ncbi:MAG: hypothetical protein ABII26_07970 [Pseudomonadota bacterium]
MNRRFLGIPVTLLCFLILFFNSKEAFTEKDDGPIIHFEETAYTFPASFEGVELSHTFTVTNKGRAELHIEKVAPS